MDENDDFEYDVEPFPISYSIDNLILMHRDSHFGGDFNIMLEYYKKGGRGTSMEFDIERIQKIADIQHAEGKDLSPLMLSGSEAEKIAQTRTLYKYLRALCESKSKKNNIPKLIAELILSEEEEIETVKEAIIAEKSAAVPALIDLVKSEEFYDPLAPGYGQAPLDAADCLGKIGDKRAVISLFELLGSGDFFNEDVILNAIVTLGEPAKHFLLKVMQSKPLTPDNEQAAIALINFKKDPQVASTSLKYLQEIEISKHPLLATYLVLLCENLDSEKEQKELLMLAKNPSTPKSIQLDIAATAKGWNKHDA